MNSKKEWLSTKKAIQLLKDNGIETTRQGLKYLRINRPYYAKKAKNKFHYLYCPVCLEEYIKEIKNKPNPKVWIRIKDLANELHVHVCRIYRKYKAYRIIIKYHIGITYVNRQEFIKKYKEEYNGTTDGRKEARN